MKIQELKKKIAEGFGLLQEYTKSFVFKEGWEEDVRRLGNKSRRELEEGDQEVEYLRGRGCPIVVPTNRAKLVIRHYYHGGILRWLTRDLFGSAARALKELRLMEEARREGINTTEAVGLIIDRNRLGLIRADLITIYIPESIDLFNYYLEWPINPQSDQLKEKSDVISKTAAQIRRMHKCGISHSDLQLKNILFQKIRSGGNMFILDLDKADRASPLSRREILKNLLRFYRSFQKMKLVNQAIPSRDPARFLLAYAPEDREFRKYVVRKASERSWINLIHLMRWKISIKLFKTYYARPFRI